MAGDELTMRPDEAFGGVLGSSACPVTALTALTELPTLPVGSSGSRCSAGGHDSWGAPAVAAGGGSGGIFAQLGDESRLAAGLPVYRKIRLLGRGSFGKAYLVEGTRGAKATAGGPGDSTSSPGGTTVKVRRVLKKLPLKGISEAQKEAAHQEAMIMLRVSRGCPFITQFNEVFCGKDGNALCLVMEHCSGGDLRSALRGREGEKLPQEYVLFWGAQQCLAVRHCHAHGILHRDIKPENAFLRSAGGDLLLGDFGISCTMDDKSFAKTCVGSPLYLSPEIINQERYSYATDVWSLGVMLYEMTMLSPPFKGTNICQVAFKIVSAVPEPVDEAYSSQLRRLIVEMLDKDPITRTSLEQVLMSAALAATAEAESLRYGLPWPPAAGPGTTRRKHGLVARLRSRLSGTAGGVVDIPGGVPALGECEYEDDFEALDPWECDEDEVIYDDDFEAASGGTTPSYKEDFEDISDKEIGAELGPYGGDVRQQLHMDLGPSGLAVAESTRVVEFLEAVQGSAGRRWRHSLQFQRQPG